MADCNRKEKSSVVAHRTDCDIASVSDSGQDGQVMRRGKFSHCGSTVGCPPRKYAWTQCTHVQSCNFTVGCVYQEGLIHVSSECALIKKCAYILHCINNVICSVQHCHYEEKTQNN